MDSLISKALKQARNATRREQRAKQTCRSLLKSLEQQNLINAELHAKLEAYSGTKEAFFFMRFIAVYLYRNSKCNMNVYVISFFYVNSWRRYSSSFTAAFQKDRKVLLGGAERLRFDAASAVCKSLFLSPWPAKGSSATSKITEKVWKWCILIVKLL